MIFIVDDQQAVLDAVTDILQLIELEGLTVDTAAAARRTFAQKQNEIQLILLDLTLPDEPGRPGGGRMERAGAELKAG